MTLEAPEPASSPDWVELAPGVRVAKACLRFAASRAGGPGGQNVNRRATRVELRVALAELPLPAAALRRLRQAEASRITGEDELLITCDTHRSQIANKRSCLERLRAMINQARRPPRPRIATGPPKASRRRRLEAKRQRGEIKKQRRKPRE